jgi:hypothetical protein
MCMYYSILSMTFSIVSIYHKFLCIHDTKIPKKIIHNYMIKKCMIVYGLTKLKGIYGHDKKKFMKCPFDFQLFFKHNSSFFN